MWQQTITYHAYCIHSDNSFIVYNYGLGWRVEIGEPWNILENLWGGHIFWRFTGGLWKPFELLYLRYACQYYGTNLQWVGAGCTKVVDAFEGGSWHFFMHSMGAMTFCTITKHFNPSPAIIVLVYIVYIVSKSSKIKLCCIKYMVCLQFSYYSCSWLVG